MTRRDPIKILVVEDNPDDLTFLQEMLSGVADFPVDLRHCVRLGEAMDYVKEVSFHPDVILLDLNLPDSRGADTFQRMRRHAPATPLVVFTGLDDEGISLTTMQGGAQDYLVKHKMNGCLLYTSPSPRD